jgi:hypothetical protein
MKGRQLGFWRWLIYILIKIILNWLTEKDD